MAFANIWAPDATAIAGWMIEVPIRCPDMPANLWVHWSGISKNWGGFPPQIHNGDWHSALGVLTTTVAAGDTVLAGQGGMGIAAAHREEQGIFDTDDWGMAIDGVAPLAGRVDGPGNVYFTISLRTLGNCWPVAISLVIDLLVLRPSLIPGTPAPYGTHPKRRSWRDLILDRTRFIDELRQEDRLKLLRELVSEAEMDEMPEAGPTSAVPGLPRRAVVGLSMSLTTMPMPQWRPPAAPGPAAKPPRRRRR